MTLLQVAISRKNRTLLVISVMIVTKLLIRKLNETKSVCWRVCLWLKNGRSKADQSLKHHRDENTANAHEQSKCSSLS